MKNFLIGLIGAFAIIQVGAALDMIGEYAKAIEKDGTLLIIAIPLLTWYALTIYSFWLFPLVLLRNPNKTRIATSFGLRFSATFIGLCIATADALFTAKLSVIQLILLIVISLATILVNPVKT